MNGRMNDFPTKRAAGWGASRLDRRLIAVALSLFISCLGSNADMAFGQAATPQLASTHVAWKVALVQLGVPASTSVALDVLSTRFGATGAEAQGVLLHGQRFLSAVRDIERAAREEAARAYPLPQGAPRTSRPGATEIFLPTGVSDVKSLLIRDGRIARVEHQREDALAALQRALRQTLSPSLYSRIDDWVNLEVRPRIRPAEPAAGRNPTTLDLSKLKLKE